MLVDDILERNRDWVRGHQPQPLPPPTTVRLAVVACYDPRLDSLLLPALGLHAGDVFLLRSAGALLQPGSTTMRSLAMAIFMFGVTEVVIVGHASCRMAAFDTAAFIEEFRRRGVPREAFGDESLRTWVGAIPSPRQGVLISVAAVREAPFVPNDVHVSGVVLDETTGRLDLVARADQPVEPVSSLMASRPIETGGGHSSAETSAAEGVDARRVAASDAAAGRAAAMVGSGATSNVIAAADALAAAEAAAATRNAAAPRSAKRARAGGRSAAPPPPPPAAAPGATGDTAAASPRVAQARALLQAADGFLTTIESKEHWKADVENLRMELERRRDPRQRLELLDAFAKRLGGESREVAESFARLRREIAAAGADPTAELLSVFHHLGRRR